MPGDCSPSRRGVSKISTRFGSSGLVMPQLPSGSNLASSRCWFRGYVRPPTRYSPLRGRFPIVLRSRPKPSQSVRSSAATGVLASICPIIAEAPGTLRNQGAAHEMHTRPTQGGRSTMTRADQLREWASKCEQTSSAILIEQLQREAATRYRTMAEREINEPEVAAAPQQDLEILNLEGLVARQAEDITILRS